MAPSKDFADTSGANAQQADESRNENLEKLESAENDSSENGTPPADKERRRSSIPQNFTPDGKRIITEYECDHVTGHNWPTWKKWMLLSSIFAVQVSMNFNTSVYPSAVPALAEYWHISEQGARVGQMIFLILYAFGCELWAPWSEEFGRWPILQISLFLVNMWQLPAALAPNWASIVVARALGGLSSAGGSVTIGMVADLWPAESQQWAVAFVVLSSVLGTSVGPFAGAPIAAFVSWRWNFWTQLIFGGVVQAIHFFMPESRATILMDREAKRRRKTGEDPNVYGPNEVKQPRIEFREFLVTWMRPFEMFVREPIVLSMSLLSGFSDALIFTFQEAFPLVYEQWGFSTLSQGWTFIPIVVGYFIAYISYFPWIARDRRIIKRHGPDAIQPEARLWWLLWLAPLLSIGLFGFAWTSLGPPRVHWIAPMIFSACVAIANYAIYMSTIDYMVAAYGVYSASATGGNGFARDFLAGVSAMYATPLYENVGNDLHLEYGSTILACLAVVVTIPIYICYVKGPWIRKKSKFAMSLEKERRQSVERRASLAGEAPLARDDVQV